MYFRLGGISIGMKDFLSMMHPEVLQTKAKQMNELANRIESMSERMRNQ